MRVFSLHHGLLGVLAALAFACPTAQASSVAISSKSVSAPAVDLLYNGGPIDGDQALDLKNHQFDLSQLNPLESDVWTPAPLPLTGDGQSYPKDGATVDYDSLLLASNGLFRSRIVSTDSENIQSFQLIVSLDQHAALARAGVLRRLGYTVPNPRWYKTLTVRFADIKARDGFLDAISDATQTTRARWIHGALPTDKAEVTLQDVTLEPGQIDIPAYHWGVVPSTHLKGRRALRALLIPLVMLDIEESINLYSFEMGKTFDNAVILTHPYADQFVETTFDDARWIARMIAGISRAEFQQIVRLAAYPPDVAALVTEKLIARRNQLILLFNLDKDKQLPPDQRALPYFPHLSTGNVKDGKLMQENYGGYAERFRYPNPDSPLRKSEIGRFLLLKSIDGAIETAVGVADTFLAANQNSVSTAHAQNVTQSVFNYQQAHPGVPYTVPIKAWVAPIGGVNVATSRNVVAGTYYGSDSKVQLVDELTVAANVGLFLGFDGLPVVGVSGSSNLTVSRDYVHVRPLADMQSALKSNWLNMFVPKFLGGLAGALDTTGLENDQIKIDAKLKGFIDSLKPNELMIITDAISLAVQGQVSLQVPLSMIPMINPTVSVVAGSTPMILRRTTIRRTNTGIQVYLQTAEILNLQAQFNFNWVMSILGLSHESKQGWAQTKAYLLDKEPDSPAERRNLVLALRALLHAHDSEILQSDFKDYQLDHSMTSHIDQANILFWKWAGIKESHRVTIRPPDHPEAARTLYSSMVTAIHGIDGYDFLSGIVSGLTSGVVNISGKGTGVNPANSFLGSANWASARTEAETTPNVDFAPVTQIQHHFGGWTLSKKGLFKILDGMEVAVRPLNLDHPLIRRDEFQSTQSLQMFDVMSTLIIYQPGMTRISKTVFEPAHIKEAVDAMTAIEGAADLKKWCSAGLRGVGDTLFGINSYSEKENGKKVKFKCLKPWMISLLKARHNFIAGKTPKNSENRVVWVNSLMRMLEKKVALPKLLTWLGKDNFFFNIKISGFRTADENGDHDYISDSVGSADQTLGSGVFSNFAAKYDILSSELTANYLGTGY